MNNMIETAKNEVKEIIMSALGRLIAEGKLPAEPLPGFEILNLHFCFHFSAPLL